MSSQGGAAETEDRSMRYWKMNGAGNAFAILDHRGGAPDMPADLVRALAEAASADQVIAIEDSDSADAFMRVWNADGGEVGACGNAARCVAWGLMEESGAETASLDTLGGPLKAWRAGERMITIDMGEPKLDWEQIPLDERMDTRGIDVKLGPIDKPSLQLPGAVNMGNPHVVFFVPEASEALARAVGPLIEWHPLFPEGVNVGFAEILSQDRIRLKVWERGAGLTAACGTGACAALVAASRRQLTGRKAIVIADGGELEIDWRADNRVYKTGPVEMEGEARFEPAA